jgi:hypothetical protein
MSWNKEQPDHVWGGGVFGMLKVTPDGAVPLRNLIPGVGEWLQLPETVSAEIDLGGQIEIVNLAHGPDITGTPSLEIWIGPVGFNTGWRIVDGGQIGDLLKSQPVFFLGVRPIRF